MHSAVTTTCRPALARATTSGPAGPRRAALAGLPLARPSPSVRHLARRPLTARRALADDEDPYKVRAYRERVKDGHTVRLLCLGGNWPTAALLFLILLATRRRAGRVGATRTHAAHCRRAA